MTGSWRATLSAGKGRDQTTPEPPQVDWAVPHGPELGALLKRLVSKAFAELPKRPSRRLERGLVIVLHDWLVDPRLPRISTVPWLEELDLHEAGASPAMTPAGLIKLMMVTGRFTIRRPGGRGARRRQRRELNLALLSAFHTQHRVTGRPSLLEIAALLDQCRTRCDLGEGDGADFVTAAYLSNILGEGWAEDAVRPFVARHLDRLVTYLVQRTDDEAVAVRFCDALETLPTLPEHAVDQLYELAVSPHPTHRFAAIRLLRGHPDRVRRVVPALEHPDHRVRIAAADWLARVQDRDAVPALERAVSQERTESARNALLVALDALGQPASRFLTPEQLNRVAASSANKPVPEGLEWFPWDSLPEVRWAETDEPVPGDTLVWLITEAVERGALEPDARLRAYCRMFRNDDRRRLGRFLLEAWIAEDTRPLPESEAVKRARRRAQRRLSSASSSQTGSTLEELTARHLARYANQPAGSARISCGLLAVVAVCAGPDVVPVVEQYVIKWQQRSLECEAVLEMLASMDHPAAIQLWLSLITRLHHRPVQQYVWGLAEQAAFRRGWTLAELADRMVPTAGFDPTGQLELSYGPRSFIATLTPDLTIQLRDPDGTPIRFLPRPRESDDAAAAQAAKHALSTARKQLTTTVTQQTTRLYEAMCFGRTWSVEEWRTYLADHPVLRHLVRRLVWTATWGEPAHTVSFRPLDDGTLTDAHDNEVTLPEGSRIQIAHDVTVPAEEAAAWRAHLVDYEVTPPFQQFGRGAFRLDRERCGEQGISDFEGCELPRPELRRRATKLGYTGGTADGERSYEYRKVFPTYGVATVITARRGGDDSVPRGDRVAVLTRLFFEPLDFERPVLRLGEVPEVLLSEAFHDIAQLAQGARRRDTAHPPGEAQPPDEERCVERRTLRSFLTDLVPLGKIFSTLRR